MKQPLKNSLWCPGISAIWQSSNATSWTHTKRSFKICTVVQPHIKPSSSKRYGILGVLPSEGHLLSTTPTKAFQNSLHTHYGALDTFCCLIIICCQPHQKKPFKTACYVLCPRIPAIQQASAANHRQLPFRNNYTLRINCQPHRQQPFRNNYTLWIHCQPHRRQPFRNNYTLRIHCQPHRRQPFRNNYTLRIHCQPHRRQPFRNNYTLRIHCQPHRQQPFRNNYTLRIHCQPHRRQPFRNNYTLRIHCQPHRRQPFRNNYTLWIHRQPHKQPFRNNYTLTY